MIRRSSPVFLGVILRVTLDIAVRGFVRVNLLLLHAVIAHNLLRVSAPVRIKLLRLLRHRYSDDLADGNALLLFVQRHIARLVHHREVVNVVLLSNWFIFGFLFLLFAFFLLFLGLWLRFRFFLFHAGRCNFTLLKILAQALELLLVLVLAKPVLRFSALGLFLFLLFGV